MPYPKLQKECCSIKIRGTIDGLSMIIHRNCYIDADWITHTSIAATEDAYNNHNDDVDCFLNGLIITDNLSTLSKENPLIGHWAGDKNPEMKYFFSANKVHIGQPYRESNEFPYEILDSSSDSIKIRILGYLGSFNMDFIFHGKRNATKVFRLRTAVTEEEIHWVNRMQKP